jgi:hypothetical protein
MTTIPDIPMGYTLYTNIDARFMRPYQPGDRLVRGYIGTMPDSATDPARFAEAVYARHNRDDRPDGQMCPSMSVGDVVVFGKVALSVDSFGFATVAIDPTDVITDRTWLDMMRAEREAGR